MRGKISEMIIKLVFDKFIIKIIPISMILKFVRFEDVK